MAQAHAADNSAPQGPLHGLPIAVKDLANVAGLPTSMGSPLFAGTMAKTSDIMVQRMQDAGANTERAGAWHDGGWVLWRGGGGLGDAYAGPRGWL